MRINKRMAELGLASRREADSLIAAGQVLVNGVRAVLGQAVTEADTIEVVGKTKKLYYYAYHKPRGIITHSPAPHETDIATQIAADYGITGVAPIGRLDKDSDGLIILSNDGRLTTKLVGAESNVEKEYAVTVDKPVTDSVMHKLSVGVDIEGYRTKPAVAKKRSDKSFTLTLTEGKKHQIRRMCAALGYQVQQLTRIRVGRYTLDSMQPGDLQEITPKLLGF